MKKIKSILSLIFLSGISCAQNGLDSIIVETYYISNANDSIGSTNNGGGILPAGSITYRLYADLTPGYKFQALYGVNAPLHALLFTTTTSFFNNEDRGATSPTYTKTQAKDNSVMLDSWFSVGAGCAGQFGILKSEDDGVATVVNNDGMLQNNDPSAGISLTSQDGLFPGTPESVTFVGLSTELDVFDATSQLNDSFYTANGSVAALNGATGPTSFNRVLIGQFTTNGQLCYELNIQLGTPTGGIENWVAKNPQGNEVTHPSLMRCFQSSPVGVHEQNAATVTVFTLYPNPTNDQVLIEIDNLNERNSNSYAIYNVEGKLLLHKKLGGSAKTYSERIDISSFADGLYIMEVSTGETSCRKPIFKIH